MGDEAARRAALSPDGRTVVFTVQEWSVEKNKSTTNLWLVDVAGGEPRRLTTAQATDSAPAWSPDGKRIAFVSKRGDDETSALYVIPVGGGEAEEIVEMPFALAAPKWLPDGEQIIVGTSVIPELAGTLAKKDIAAMKKEAKRRKDSKMTAKVTENRQYRYLRSIPHRQSRVASAARERRDQRGRGPYARFRSTVSCRRRIELRNLARWIPNRRGDQFHAAALSRLSKRRHLSRGDQWLGPVEEPDRRKQRQRRQPGLLHRTAARSSISGAKPPTTTASSRGSGGTIWAPARVRRCPPMLDYSFDEVKFSPDGQDAVAAGRGQGRAPGLQDERRRNRLHGRLQRRFVHGSSNRRELQSSS